MVSLSACFTLSPTYSHRIFHSKPLIRLKPPHSFPRIQTLIFPRIAKKVPAGRVLVRAGIDSLVAGAIRPGGAVETDKLPSDVRKRAMDAVDDCGGRVTVGDVASKAGLKLAEAQRALQAIASDTDGFLEVSDEGDVLYIFPKDYRTKLAAKSLRIKIEPFLAKAKGGAEYLIRASFGTALVASILLVYTTIIALLSSRSEEDNRGRRGGRSYNSGFNFYLNPTDLFWYWDPYYYRRRRVKTNDDDNKMNFIESVFSFVFGDGDPNEGIEEERWKLIGEYITSNGGVVTAEELAPYLDVQTFKGEMSDESYILPVLLRFDGQPEIDEEGNIVYRFPSLQRTASQKSRQKEYVGRKWADWAGVVDKFFKENKWQFSKTSASERAMVVGLGMVNLFGVVVLSAMLKDVVVAPAGLIKFVTEIFPVLQIYAGSFFAIPLVRYFITQKTNADIEKRNKAREQYSRALESPNLPLRRKLLSARDMAQRTVIGQDRIIYSTDKDFVEQDYEARDWDRRFREIEKSD